MHKSTLILSCKVLEMLPRPEAVNEEGGVSREDEWRVTQCGFVVEDGTKLRSASSASAL